jgi:hypothetical protein
MSQHAWLNPAGGVRYHVRALLGARLWAPYRAALERWLSHFEPGSTRAVLVGPSAAHCIPDAFLRRFSTLVVLEPDPLAGLLFKRRARKLGLPEPRIERRDHLIRPLLEGGSGLVELLQAEPESSVVFCNVLGQTRFLMNEEEFLRFTAAFRERVLPALAGRAWLSFHDRLSGAIAPRFVAPVVTPARLSDAELLRELYGSESTAHSAELLDHESEHFFPSHLPHAYFAWQIDRARWHLIEGVSSSNSSA